MQKKRFISVPLNEIGELALEFGREDSVIIKEWELNENQFFEIYRTGIFDLINKECDLNIDDFESEWIDFKMLANVRYILDTPNIFDNDENCLNLIREIVDFALKNKSGISFDF